MTPNKKHTHVSYVCVVGVCRVGAEEKAPSISHKLRGRGWYVDRRNIFSVLHFERERGWGVCVDREPLRLAICAREGLVVIHRQRKYPFRLTLRASEGVEVEVVMCRQREHPLRLTFEWGRGWRGCADQEPLRLAIRAREGLVVKCRQKQHPLRLAFRAREGVEAATRQRDLPFVVLLLLIVSKLKSN